MADPVRYYLGEGWHVQFLSRPLDGDPKGTLKARLTERDQLRLEATFAGIELYRGKGANPCHEYR